MCMCGNGDRASGRYRRVRDALIGARLATRTREARWLILSGRVILDGRPVVRPNEALPVGESTIEVHTHTGIVMIRARGDGIEGRV